MLERDAPHTAPPRALTDEPLDGTPLDAERFVRRFQAGVFRYLRLLGAATADAEDLTQDTFLRFLDRQPPAPDAAGLLRTIARGLFVDQQRRDGAPRSSTWLPCSITFREL